MRIMGIDPGIAIVGFGIVDLEGSRLKPVQYGCIETPAHTEQGDRLLMIHDSLSQLIEKYKPNQMAVERLFFNRNVTTAFNVAEARGVIILTGVQNKLFVAEYTPLQVKQAIVGYGKAEKRQVQEMVRMFLNLREIPKPDDVADALAVAICHAHSNSLNDRIKDGNSK
ncbi:MAG: crossover junction endodeoxyribonuclease RuvC [Paenibacillaceae bacterium]